MTALELGCSPRHPGWDAGTQCQGRYAADGLRNGPNRLLQSYGVTRAYLFGSIAECRAGPESDVDLLVLGVSPAAYWDLRRDLEQALGRPLDLFTQDDDPVFVAKVMARSPVIYGPNP